TNQREMFGHRGERFEYIGVRAPGDHIALDRRDLLLGDFETEARASAAVGALKDLIVGPVFHDLIIAIEAEAVEEYLELVGPESAGDNRLNRLAHLEMDERADDVEGN